VRTLPITAIVFFRDGLSVGYYCGSGGLGVGGGGFLILVEAVAAEPSVL